MAKKLFKIFLISGILSLFIFGANFSLAVEAPTILSPSCGEEEQSVSVWLDWEDEDVDHYELYYKRADEDNWTDRYPEVSRYHATGLAFGKTYEWYVVSCGNQDCSISAASQPCSFATKEFIPSNGGTPGGGGPVGLINPLAADTLEEALNAFINFLFWLAMAVAPILIIYAGFLLLTAAGDPAKISKAKQVIIWTLVAVAIILFAKGLPALIKGVFGG